MQILQAINESGYILQYKVETVVITSQLPKEASKHWGRSLTFPVPSPRYLPAGKRLCWNHILGRCGRYDTHCSFVHLSGEKLAQGIHS